MKRISVIKFIILLSLSLFICACGFQLRGAGNHNLSDVKIYLSQNEKLDTKKAFRSFLKEFKRSLKQTSAELVSNPDAGSDQLNIVEFKFTSQGVSRDATGRANEHEVTLRLDYQLNDQIKQVVNDSANVDNLETELSVQSLSVTTSYYQDYRNPTAGRVQKNETHQMLISQLTQRLIRQLEFQLKN